MLHSPDPTLPWAPNVLLRTEVGSTAHGVSLEGTDDYDELGVFSLTAHQQIALPPLSDSDETIIYRPGRKPTDRSLAGDYDLALHSSRKFARLAAHGNPSILMVFFGPLRFTDTSGLGQALRDLHPAFWNQQARHRFDGYAKAQRERMQGVRGGKHTNRPELVSLYGYDTKYAYHMLRLWYQGVEYLKHGYIESPIPNPMRQILLDVRQGQFDLDTVLKMSEQFESELLTVPSSAPATPDYSAINRWLMDVWDHYCA